MKSTNLLLSLFLVHHLFFLSNASSDASEQHPYIVHVRQPENRALTSRADLESWYSSFLPPTAASGIIYSYVEVLTGFAAQLTEEEVKWMEKKEGFVTAYQDRPLPLLTTHTPAFLGLEPGHGIWDDAGMGKGTIIGVFDTGIVPGHPSFNDEGIPPPPSKWKGRCLFDKGVGCNNKVIGAVAYLKIGSGGNSTGDTPSPDATGHGTQVAGTVAGNFVKNANELGMANGTAAGTAPHAHLAIYQVCQQDQCFQADILAGMDAAIQDGVDVMTTSLGLPPDAPFYVDPIAIGAFSAMEKGIFVSTPAGNGGADEGTVVNAAPWILTVGAGTTDRRIRATVKLGNGEELFGESAFQPSDYKSTMLPLVRPKRGKDSDCVGSVGRADVKGKMVACRVPAMYKVELGSRIKNLSGAGFIGIDEDSDGYTTLADVYELPASNVNYGDGLKIMTYIDNTSNPTASFSFQGTVFNTTPTPTVASFSSRGPALQCSGILKPDVIGPGVNILAPGLSGFSFVSGTSLSNSHLAGIAAMIKSKHPDWSPAMIKSAIMTTSDDADRDGKRIMDETLNPASYFDMGAGHVNPSKAVDPGLVYDLGSEDYVAFLCGLGYDENRIKAITNRWVNCKNLTPIKNAELNYPSVVLHIYNQSITVERTVTNVGEGVSKYIAQVAMPKEVSVSVTPQTLEFSKVMEKKSFKVTVTWNSTNEDIGPRAEGALKWVSDKYLVRTPIAVIKLS